MRGKATRKEQDQVDAQVLGWNRLFILVVLILIVIVIGLGTRGDFYCCFCYCYCFFPDLDAPKVGTEVTETSPHWCNSCRSSASI